MHRVLLSCLFLISCGQPPSRTDAGTDAGGGTTFIALQGDFAHFESWQAFDFGDDMGDTVHVPGHRVVYLKARPPHDAGTWPVGTMLVKEVTPDDGGVKQIFGMAKRGGTFNPDAPGWEWFELQPDTDPPQFLWRGTTPPAGAYGDGTVDTCAACHGYADWNDYVMGMPLFLSNF